MTLSARHILLEVLALIVLLAIAGAGLLAWRLSEGPLELDFLKPELEKTLTDARDGRPVSLEAFSLEWSEDRHRIEARFEGISLKDRDGQEQVKAERGTVSLDTVALLRGQIQVSRISLQDGTASVHRNSAQQWRLGSVANPDDPLPQPAMRLDLSQWRNALPVLRDIISRQAFESVQFSDFDVQIIDSLSGVSWIAKDAMGDWTANTNGVQIDLSMTLEGDGAPKAIDAKFSSDTDIEQFAFTLGVEQTELEQLVSLLSDRELPFQLSGLADVNVAGDASEFDGLKTVQVSAHIEDGVLGVEDNQYKINALDMRSVLELNNHILNVAQLQLDMDRISGAYTGRFDLGDYFNETDSPEYPLYLTIDEANWDLSPVFDRRWDIETAEISAILKPDERSLELKRAIATSKGLKATASGKIWLEDRQPTQKDIEKFRANNETAELPETVRKVGARITANGEGSANKEAVLSFWPVGLGAGARSWVVDHVNSGLATRLDFEMDLRPEIYERGYLDDETLSLDFWVEDADVWFLNDIPPISQASGIGRLKGNSLTIELEEGKFREWNVDAGKVDIPRFRPQGERALVTASGRGDMKSLIQILEDSDLKVATRAEIEMDSLDGFGGLDVEVSYPIQEKRIETEDVSFSFKGGFLDVAVANMAHEFGLEKTEMNVDVDNERIVLSGEGLFGPAPVDFVWTERFPLEDEAFGETRLEAHAIATPDLLNTFGFAVRNVMTGEADMRLVATGVGSDFDEIDARLDLTGATIDISELGWFKRAGEPATGDFNYARDSEGRMVAFGDITADGLALSGDVTFDSRQQLQSANIERFYAADRMDLKGALTKTDDDGFRIAVSGPMLNASGFMDNLLEFGAGGGGDFKSGKVEATIAVDELILREDASLTNANISIETNEEGVQKGFVTGTIGPERGLEATLDATSGQQVVELLADDAGWVLKTLSQVDYLEGGAMRLNGRFTEEEGFADINIRSVRLKNAPLLAQIFSLASLQGLTDVLSGEGVLFTNIEAPIKLREGRIEIDGARASGPAMGLTVRGWVGAESRELGLDGVVVPSFGVNSALGGIPIIGDLFVSRRGEGVFAVVYNVRGNLERARVAINPLSAVTPGFLRRIMEDPGRPPEVPAPKDKATDEVIEDLPVEEPVLP